MKAKRKCKPTKKKSSASSAPKKVLTIGGKRYTKSSCHTTKASATAAAKKARAAGKNARVSGKCVYTRRKTKA